MYLPDVYIYLQSLCCSLLLPILFFHYWAFLFRLNANNFINNLISNRLIILMNLIIKTLTYTAIFHSIIVTHNWKKFVLHSLKQTLPPYSEMSLWKCMLRLKTIWFKAMKTFSLAKSLCFDKKVNRALYLTLQVIVNILLHTGLSLCSSSGYKVIQLCMCLNMI